MDQGLSFFQTAPDLVYKCLLDLLQPQEIIALSKVCHKSRILALEYLRRNPQKRQELALDYGRFEFGRSIIFDAKKMIGQRRARNEYLDLRNIRMPVEDYHHLLEMYIPRFEVTHIKTRTLDEATISAMGLEMIPGCCNQPSQVLLFEMDKCQISSERLGEALNSFDPVNLHLYGRFQRSVITGTALPNRVQNLYITEHPMHPEAGTELVYADLVKILESWKTTTDEGMIMEHPTYLHTNVHFQGNYRRLDLDKCNLTRTEAEKLQKMACNRLGINQIINFHNVTDAELLQMVNANPAYFSEPLGNLEIEKAVDEMGIQNWGICAYRQQRNNYVGVAAQELDYAPAMRVGEPNLHGPTLMSFAMNFYPGEELVRALLPVKVDHLGGGQWTLSRRKKRRAA